MRQSLKSLFFLVAVGSAAGTIPGQPSVDEMVRRSVRAMEANWNAAPELAFIERDVESKHGRAKTIRTHRVLMIEGSQYDLLLAINDQPLSPVARDREERKLQREIARRRTESPSERERRIAKYRKERTQDQAMLKEMVDALTFRLSGEGVMDGRRVWVLDAVPKPGYQPRNNEARVLTGMRGRLWIDQEQIQWVKVEAEVFRPVFFFGFLAKVDPGTRFMLEQAPWSGDVWMPKHFTTSVRARALGMIDESSTDDESYRDYQPMQAALAMSVKGDH